MPVKDKAKDSGCLFVICLLTKMFVNKEMKVNVMIQKNLQPLICRLWDDVTDNRGDGRESEAYFDSRKFFAVSADTFL